MSGWVSRLPLRVGSVTILGLCILTSACTSEVGSLDGSSAVSEEAGEGFDAHVRDGDLDSDAFDLDLGNSFDAGCIGCDDLGLSVPDAGPPILPIPSAVGEVVPQAIDWTQSGGVVAFSYVTVDGPAGSLARVGADGQLATWLPETAPSLVCAEVIRLVRAEAALFVVWSSADGRLRFASVSSEGSMSEVRVIELPGGGPPILRLEDVSGVSGNLLLAVSTGSSVDDAMRIVRQPINGDAPSLWPLEIRPSGPRRFLAVRDRSRAVAVWLEPHATAAGHGSMRYGWFELDGTPGARSESIFTHTPDGFFFGHSVLGGAVTTQRGLFILHAEEREIWGVGVWATIRNNLGMSSGELQIAPDRGVPSALSHVELLRASREEVAFAVYRPTSNPNRFWIDVHRTSLDRAPLGSARLVRTARVVAYEGGTALSCVGESGVTPGLRCRSQSIP